MTLTLELTPAQEAEARARAARHDPDADADAYLAALMRYALDVYTPEECGPPPGPGESVYDSIKDLIGTIDSEELAELTQNTAEAFTKYVAEKHYHGKL